MATEVRHPSRVRRRPRGRAGGGPHGHGNRGDGDAGQVFRGAATSLVGTALSMASGLLVVALLTRTLGVGGYGALAVAVSLAALVQAFTHLGLSNGAARMIAFARAEGDEAAGLRMLRAALSVGLVTGLTGSAIMALLGAARIVEGADASTALLILSPVVLATGLRSTLNGALRAYRDLRALLILKLASPIVDVAVVGGLVAVGVRSVVSFAAALLAMAFLELALLGALVRRGRTIGPLTQTTLGDVRRLLGFSLPLVVTQLMYLAIQGTDVFLLGVLRSPADAGLYAPVMRVLEGASKILSAFPLLYVPVATALVAQGRVADLRRLYVTVTKWGYALGFPIILVVVVAPGHVLPLLFGDAYADVEGVARILALGYWAVLVTGLNGVTLAALGAVRPMMILSVLGTALNLGLGLTLIPRFGPAGAAWSNTLSYTAVNLVFSVLLYRRARVSPLRRDSAALFAFSAVLLGGFTLAALGREDMLTGIGIALAAVTVWGAGVLLGRPFRMGWGELKAILRGGGDSADSPGGTARAGPT